VMFVKLNPLGIVRAHFTSLRSYQNNKLSFREVGLHIGLPVVLAIAHFYLVDDITEGVVGIIVSAASIVAGLMLNLLVLIYTLVYNAKTNASKIANIDDFKQVSYESLSTIAYSIFLCLLLVIFSFMILSRFPVVAGAGRLVTVYLGVSTILCLLLVLKRCYSLVNFELRH
jgi:hypothetical protein